MLINRYIKKKENMMGFGDFIRGSISCCQLAQEEDLPFEIDFGHFQQYFKPVNVKVPLTENVLNFRNKGSYLEFKNRLSLYVRRDWNLYRKQNISIYTNTWPRDSVMGITAKGVDRLISWGEIDQEIKTFIKDRLDPNELLLKDYPDPGKDYEILHIRAGDPNAFGKDESEGSAASLDAITGYIMRMLPDIYDEAITRGNQLLILSDSTTLKEHLESILNKFKFENKRLKFSQNDTAHSGNEACIETMYDFLTLINAKHIHQTSVYHWGSGFSNIAKHIFDVPITQYPQIL